MTIEWQVFTYGTLMIPEVVTTLLGRSFPYVDARLENYGRFSVKDRPYPGIIQKAGACTDGRLYRGLDGQSIEMLDDFEGMMYSRLTRRLRIEEQQEEYGEVYIVNQEYKHMLLPLPWDLQWFQEEWLEAYLRTCQDFRMQWLGR